MNTIILSIRVLSENLSNLQGILKEVSLNKDLELKTQTILEECLEIVRDLEENASVAVGTLSDLINYDKIETKSFTIEKNDVNVWSVVEKTIHPLGFQAKEKNIEMKLISQLSNPTEFKNVDIPLKNLRLIGDTIKLGQVVRNLVSNALKFTPINGNIDITGLFVCLLLLCFLFIYSYSFLIYFHFSVL